VPKKKRVTFLIIQSARHEDGRDVPAHYGIYVEDKQIGVVYGRLGRTKRSPTDWIIASHGYEIIRVVSSLQRARSWVRENLNRFKPIEGD
jgi:hypothetical protein